MNNKPTGRDMDAWVMEKVLGLKPCPHNRPMMRGQSVCSIVSCDLDIPEHYSTNIADALAALEAMVAADPQVFKYFQDEAEKRRETAGKEHGRGQDRLVSIDANLSDKPKTRGKATQAAGQAANVSAASVDAKYRNTSLHRARDFRVAWRHDRKRRA